MLESETSHKMCYCYNILCYTVRKKVTFTVKKIGSCGCWNFTVQMTVNYYI